MKFNFILIIACNFYFLMACSPESVNTDPKSMDVILKPAASMDLTTLSYQDTIYVPIYSDIYSESKDVKFLLTATLSIRNTSLKDTLFIGDINYYGSGGDFIRNYLDNEILVLKPMQSVEYVIERNDAAGGTGANFIVTLAGQTTTIKPILQGVMISTHGQQGISFLTEGVSIAQKSALKIDSLNSVNWP